MRITSAVYNSYDITILCMTMTDLLHCFRLIIHDLNRSTVVTVILNICCI